MIKPFRRAIQSLRRRGRTLAALSLWLLVGAALGVVVARLDWAQIGDGRALTVFIVAVLVGAIPLNALAVRAAIQQRAVLKDASRPALYVNTAALWLGLGGLSLLAAALSEGWLSLAPLHAPTDAAALAGLGAAAAAAGGLALSARDLKTNRRKRARLRRFYRRGVGAIAPRDARELWWFRGATAVSSVGEEIAYRLLLLQALSAWLGAPLGVVLSAGAFALGHAYQGATAASITGAFGLATALLTIMSGSLWPAILLHVLWNQIAGGMLREVYRTPRRAGAQGRA